MKQFPATGAGFDLPCKEPTRQMGSPASPHFSFFEKSWNSPYAELLDPCGVYEPPRRN